ncbi:type IV pilin-like G/H family protein [Acaryochloris sp. IP29b_bin.137]|uniref:type IV pilin-like G/H family protein n=1 Tax=Acaryochloris sp. IP29b_bin.137 TaxID=2969217 RepID=UPI00260F8A17|nr:type IV pilin-like G/H family protein [Acaryochloris sp. IP29b_bin.137]
MAINQPFNVPFKPIIIFCIVSLLCACSSSTDQSASESSSPTASSADQSAPPSPADAQTDLVNKARNTQAKVEIGTLLRGQQAYQLENGKFTTDLSALGVNIELESDNHIIVGIEAGETVVTMKATAKEQGLNSYAGGVSSVDSVSERILCESNQPSQDIEPPTFEEGAWACGSDSQKVEG